MQNKRHYWVMALAIAAMIAACGSDDTSSTNTNTTDTATGTADAGTSGGDATSTGGDAASAGGACLSGPATPTGGWGEGCKGADDQKYFGDEAKANGFPALIRGCTLGGCAGSGDDAAFKKCVGDCIVTKSGLSQSCSDCYGTWAGWCGFKMCLTVCAVDDGTGSCDKCLAEHCTCNRDACTQHPPS